MNRIAALYDIHGNLPALEAVLEDVFREGIEEILVGGDVLPGPMSAETLERVWSLDRPVRFIAGNGERDVLSVLTGSEPAGLPGSVLDVLRWVAGELGPDDVAGLEAWPSTVLHDIEGLGRALFCHATPQSDTEIFTKLTPEESLRPLFEGLDADIVVCGHTHMQLDRMVGRVRVVNAGSVGMPFGAPAAYWLSLGAEVRLRRTEYDLSEAADRVRRTGYPQAGEFAERWILRPKTEAEGLDAFERVALQGDPMARRDDREVRGEIDAVRRDEHEVRDPEGRESRRSSS